MLWEVRERTRVRAHGFTHLVGNSLVCLARAWDLLLTIHISVSFCACSSGMYSYLWMTTRLLRSER
jgi:hypothetical protein